MATTDALSHDTDAHDHHDGEHPSFLAHHFDTPEQQYDSGKLGMWLFLVTEVLFFSGLFCAYAIFRALRPEVFAGASVFLNTQLGAINTGVLLFSSLTMAWAVRCAQTEEHKKLTGFLAATLGCAAIFLGVKAIEYAHKFEMGLLPAGLFSYDPAVVIEHHLISKYLVWMSAPFALILVGLGVWYVIACIGRNKFQMRVAGPLTICAACYFVGVGLGMVLESGGDEAHAAESHGEYDAAVSAALAETVEQSDQTIVVAGMETASADLIDDGAVAAVTKSSLLPEGVDDAMGQDQLMNRLAADATNTGVLGRREAELRQEALSSGRIAVSSDDVVLPVEKAELAINSPYLMGVFFSIYYCMTGIHAIHILAGMGVLTWLLVRSVRKDFNRQYFGPVDYVGLYWHIVDLIWIYLFPLLYLIR